MVVTWVDTPEAEDVNSLLQLHDPIIENTSQSDLYQSVSNGEDGPDQGYNFGVNKGGLKDFTYYYDDWHIRDTVIEVVAICE